jgi:hypothetical protein
MARRTFDVIDVTEILMHWHAGRSKNEMAGSRGVDRKTLRKYIAPAEAAGIVPGGPAKSAEEWAELVRGWFPQLADTRLRQVTWPAISEHHEFITGQLKAGVRMSTIHQRLRDEHGLAVSVQSFRRYVAASVPEEIRRSQVVVWNPRPAEAGEQAQIDYGQLGRWLDPVSGKLRTVWAFVMVLACSRHMFVRPVRTTRLRALGLVVPGHPAGSLRAVRGDAARRRRRDAAGCVSSRCRVGGGSAEGLGELGADTRRRGDSASAERVA